MKRSTARALRRLREKRLLGAYFRAQVGHLRHLPSLRRSEDPIIVFGAPGSGTTFLGGLLGQALESHVYCHEHKVFLHRSVRLARALRRMPSSVFIGALAASLRDLRLWTLDLHMPGREELRSVGNLSGFDPADPRSSPRRGVVDSSPYRTEAVLLLLESLPRARVVIIDRDPGDVLEAIVLRKSFSDTQSTTTWAERLVRFGRERLAVDWDTVPGAVSVRYEDLVADTATELERVLRALDLGYDRERVDAAVRYFDREDIERTGRRVGNVSIATEVPCAKVPPGEMDAARAVLAPMRKALGYADH